MLNIAEVVNVDGRARLGCLGEFAQRQVGAASRTMSGKRLKSRGWDRKQVPFAKRKQFGG